MAHVTEMTQASMYDPGPEWCSSWGPEKIESQWKAPTPRTTEQPKHPPILPSWLANWTPMPEQPTDVITEATNVGESTGKGFDVLRQERHIREHFHDFEKAIKVHRRECTGMKRDGKGGEKEQTRHQHLTGSTEALELCSSFSDKLQRSLTLGLVTSDLLCNSLRAVTHVLMENHSGSSQLLAFYRQVCDGILACKVLEPADFDSTVMREYLSLLSNLPSTNETQLLVSDILASLSAVQLNDNVNTILSLIKSWSLSWLTYSKSPTKINNPLAKAEGSLVASQRKFNHLRMLMWSSRGKETPELFQRIREIISRASTDLSTASTELWAAESILMPHSHSIDTMSNTLSTMPRELTASLVRSHSEVICSVAFWNEKSVAGLKDYLAQSHRIRFNWLSVLSKVENIDDSIFTEAFRSLQDQDLKQFNLGAKRYSLTWRQTAELILNRWTSQGLLPNGNVILDSFRIKTLHSPSSYGLLLWTLEKHGQLNDEKIQSLLNFLRDTQTFSHIHEVLKQSKMFNVRINPNILADIVNDVAAMDVEAGCKIYMGHCIGVVEPEYCAPLFAAMIYHGSGGIWAALDAPIYAAMPRWKRNAPSPRILSQARVELIHEMAKAFAHHKVQNPRQALRNVTQCWHYLRAHKVEPTEEISRAVTQVGIIADVRNERWGRTERIRWVLDVIQDVEGPEVADAVRKAVAKWREKLRLKVQNRKDIESNRHIIQ